MENLIEVARAYGASGLSLLALGTYIIYLHKMHIDERRQLGEERKQLVEAIKEQHDEALEVTKNNTNVLIEIATIIRTQNKS